MAIPFRGVQEKLANYKYRPDKDRASLLIAVNKCSHKFITNKVNVKNTTKMYGIRETPKILTCPDSIKDKKQKKVKEKLYFTYYLSTVTCLALPTYLSFTFYIFVLFILHGALNRNYFSICITCVFE